MRRWGTPLPYVLPYAEHRRNRWSVRVVERDGPLVRHMVSQNVTNPLTVLTRQHAIWSEQQVSPHLYCFDLAFVAIALPLGHRLTPAPLTGQIPGLLWVLDEAARGRNRHPGCSAARARPAPRPPRRGRCWQPGLPPRPLRASHRADRLGRKGSGRAVKTPSRRAQPRRTGACVGVSSYGHTCAPTRDVRAVLHPRSPSTTSTDRGPLLELACSCAWERDATHAFVRGVGPASADMRAAGPAADQNEGLYGVEELHTLLTEPSPAGSRRLRAGCVIDGRPGQ